MVQSEFYGDQIEEIAKSLCGSGVTNVLPINGGRNSRIYRVEQNGRSLALKFFRPDQEGKRARFEAETSALELFEHSGIGLTPRVIAKDKEHNCVLMEWVDGVNIEQYTPEDISILVEFTQKVHEVACRLTDKNVRMATEACLNGHEIVRQINLRLNRLDQSKNDHPELKEFLDEEFIPHFNEIAMWSLKQYKRSGLDFSKDIDYKQRTLSVSDFGFHNAIRRNDKFIFLDFEFFGWDDPVKLVSDTLQHPGMSLSAEEKQILFSGFISIFEKDKEFLIRLRLLYPLFGLKWCMIMLNPFLTGYTPLGANGAIDKGHQLSMVKNITQSIYRTYKDLPYAQHISETS